MARTARSSSRLSTAATAGSGKRKSTDDAEETKGTKRAKLSRKSLDAYFSPQVLASGVPRADEEDRERKHVALNEQQIAVLKMVVEEEKNVFFTGAAGTGKSLLLRAIIAALRKKYAKKPECVSVTASTGMAASNIGGTTIHAWGAVTPGMHDIGKLISCIKTARPAHQRWKNTKVLIIDEVSMVDGHLFDTLAKLAVELRKKTDRPFGGIQLIVTGDFFQLPPVTRDKKEPFFAFNSEAWATCIDQTVTLTEVFRQKDSRFIDLLNEMRHGDISPEAKKTFISLSRPLSMDDGLLPTELFPLRNEVERANATRLSSLTGPSFKYEARDSGSAPPEKRAKLLDSMVAIRFLELKQDAQVMLIKNVDESLVNGTVGKVLGFHSISTCLASSCLPSAAVNSSPVKKESTPKHKSPSQDSATGRTLGTVRNVQVGPDGKTPLALVKAVDNKENAEESAPVSSKGKAKAKDDELYPLVEFRTPQGKETVLVVRDEFRYEDNEGKLLARRVQVPLVLAWAMSIHKSQGQTIQRVKIDLGRVFEKGQSYVAISRAATMEGLQVLRFDAKKVMAHPKVIEWSKGIE